MSHETIELNSLVITALDVYKPAKREQVLAEIYKLVEDPANRREVEGPYASKGFYEADMPTGQLVMFRTDEEGRVVEIVDFFRPWRPQGSASDATRPASAS
jgi:hypothetical protein